MLRSGEPVAHDLLERLGRHVCVSSQNDFEDGVLAACQCRFQVSLEQRGERLLVLPLRALGRERLHAVERKRKLKIHRLLGPQRAVVVEHRDARCGRYEVLPTLRGDALYEINDRLPGLAVVPGGQGIGGPCGAHREHQHASERTGDKIP